MKLPILGVFTLLIGLTLFGCMSSARLYPANDEAAHLGVLEAKYQNFGNHIFINMPNGEKMSGEFSTVDTNLYSFGKVYASVYGSGGYAYGSASGSTSTVAGSHPGMASLFGSNGTSMTCEYFVNSGSGHGAGACKDSKDRLWKVHF